MSLAIRLAFEPLRSLAFGSIGAAYTGIGTSVNHPLRQFFIQNLTDTTLVFSFNGVDDHFRLPRNGYWMEDITANKTIVTGFFLAEGSRLYVKHDGVAPTTGSADFTTIYSAEV